MKRIDPYNLPGKLWNELRMRKYVQMRLGEFSDNQLSSLDSNDKRAKHIRFIINNINYKDKQQLKLL